MDSFVEVPFLEVPPKPRTVKPETTTADNLHPQFRSILYVFFLPGIIILTDVFLVEPPHIHRIANAWTYESSTDPLRGYPSFGSPCGIFLIIHSVCLQFQRIWFNSCWNLAFWVETESKLVCNQITREIMKMVHGRTLMICNHWYNSLYDWFQTIALQNFYSTSDWIIPIVGSQKPNGAPVPALGSGVCLEAQFLPLGF